MSLRGGPSFTVLAARQTLPGKFGSIFECVFHVFQTWGDAHCDSVLNFTHAETKYKCNFS